MSADDDDHTGDRDPGTLGGFPDPPAMGYGGGPAFARRDLKERCRRAIAFLQSARDLPELSPAQIDRIERRLQKPPARPARHPVLSPALAALLVLLLAGGALAMAGRDLTWLPGIGRWLGARHQQAGVPAPRAGIQAPPAEAPRSPPAPPLATATPEPPPPVAARASSAHVEAARERTHLASRKASPLPDGLSSNVASRKACPLPDPPPRRTAGEGIESSGDVTTPPVVEPPPAAAPSALPSTTAAAAGTAPPVAASAEVDQSASASSSPAPPAATVSPIVAESRSFGAALERWHRDHDAGAALAALDVHERRFPSGQLRLEARLLRVEILLASGRDPDALSLLDQVTIAGLPRARELRTVRGELRIKLGRCTAGQADLQAVLAAGAADPFAQRARRAMAACP